MTTDLASRPLLRWDGFCLHLDLDMLELLVSRELASRAPMVRELHLSGAGEALQVTGTALWRGLPLRFALRLEELRLHRRFFGCHVESARGPLGAPLPVGFLGGLAQKYGEGLVHFGSDDHILLVDLRRFIPAGIELRIEGVSCLGRWLQISLAPGSLAAMPASSPPEGSQGSQ
jgi:hypothetical protein